MMGVGPTDGTQAPGIPEQRGVQSAGTFLVSVDRWRPRRSASGPRHGNFQKFERGDLGTEKIDFTAIFTPRVWARFEMCTFKDFGKKEKIYNRFKFESRGLSVWFFIIHPIPSASDSLGWWPSTDPACSPPLQGATTPRLPDKEKE